jgi:hypothetical protein
MLINKCWAVCEAKAYTPFIPSIEPVAYLSIELYKSLFFFKPNLCDLVIKNEETKSYAKYGFYVLPLIEENNKNDVLYDNHSISIPKEIYHELLGFKEYQSLLVRTDIF